MWVVYGNETVLVSVLLKSKQIFTKKARLTTLQTGLLLILSS